MYRNALTQVTNNQMHIPSLPSSSLIHFTLSFAQRWP